MAVIDDLKFEFEFDEGFRASLRDGDPYSETYIRLYDSHGDNLLQPLFGTQEVLVSVTSLINELLRCANTIQSERQCKVSLYLENKDLFLFPVRANKIEIQPKEGHYSNGQREPLILETDIFISGVETATREFLEVTSQVNEDLKRDPALVRIQERFEDLIESDLS